MIVSRLCWYLPNLIGYDILTDNVRGKDLTTHNYSLTRCPSHETPALSAKMS
jgi:hypothetical protein